MLFVKANAEATLGAYAASCYVVGTEFNLQASENTEITNFFTQTCSVKNTDRSLEPVNPEKLPRFTLAY